MGSPSVRPWALTNPAVCLLGKLWFPAACQTFPKHSLSLSVVRECSFWVLNAATQCKILHEPGSNSKVYSVLSDWNLLPSEIKKGFFQSWKVSLSCHPDSAFQSIFWRCFFFSWSSLLASLRETVLFMLLWNNIFQTEKRNSQKSVKNYLKINLD